MNRKLGSYRESVEFKFRKSVCDAVDRNANGILYEPERTFYPYGDGNCARIIMPKTRCDTSTSPWTWYTPPEWDLGNIVGNAKEIFQLVSLGIRYVGTFQGVASGRFPVEEFVRLEKRVRSLTLVCIDVTKFTVDQGCGAQKSVRLLQAVQECVC